MPVMIVNGCLLYVFVGIELRFPLYLPLTAVLGTAFAFFLTCRLSPAPHLPYDCAGDAYRQDYPVVWTRNTRRGLRYEMQASFRHQAHCLSVSEFGQLADNRRMQRVANAAVLQVHTREAPAVTLPPQPTPFTFPTFNIYFTHPG